MGFTRFLATHVSSPAEEIMHTVHEAVGWSVLATVGAVLVLGGARTYLLHRKTEVELAAAINRSSILKAIVDAHRNYFTPAYRSARANTRQNMGRWKGYRMEKCLRKSKQRVSKQETSTTLSMQKTGSAAKCWQLGKRPKRNLSARLLGERAHLLAVCVPVTHTFGTGDLYTLR